ncbi:MAG: DUF3662 domain-containing protein [Anaerolineales bacterium]|nr:DUF3662 domain-containing protein [Anaerolineales bacterium]
MEEKLSLLEELISSSIANSLTAPSGEPSSKNAIASQLTHEIAACARVDRQGRAYAPDQYTLSLNPLDFEDLRQRAQHTQNDLSLILKQSLEESGFLVIRDPHVTLATDPTLARYEVRVIAWHSSDPLQFTKEIDEEHVDKLSQPPAGAFFIIEGKRHFPLTQKVVKIGRRLDNHLILEDRHVSRSHARLEVVDGRYVIIDLDSTAGTRVNGRLITRHTLRPGDIVSIAAMQLIYGEDPGGPPDETSPYIPGEEPDDNHITPLNLHGSNFGITSSYSQE